ncbi:MAG: glycosyltransferase family A protein [Acidiferrobacterales bacterium]
MPKIEQVHVVIPVYNAWEQTKICLESLRSSVYKNLQTIVVDHGSKDTTKKNDAHAQPRCDPSRR